MFQAESVRPYRHSDATGDQIYNIPVSSIIRTADSE